MAIRPTTVTCTDRKNPCSLRKVFQPPYFARFVIMLVYCIYFWMPDDASHHSLGLKLLEVYVYIYIYVCVCVCYTGGPEMLVFWGIATSREKNQFSEQNQSMMPCLTGLHQVCMDNYCFWEGQKVAVLTKGSKQPKHR